MQELCFKEWLWLEGQVENIVGALGQAIYRFVGHPIQTTLTGWYAQQLKDAALQGGKALVNTIKLLWSKATGSPAETAPISEILKDAGLSLGKGTLGLAGMSMMPFAQAAANAIPSYEKWGD